MTISFELRYIVQCESYLPYPPPGGSLPGGFFKGYEKIPVQYLTTIDPDNQEMCPKPPNECSIGISSEPDRDSGREVEV